jgi:AraC-like DNA-binding protein
MGLRESGRPVLVSSEMLLGSREAAQELGVDITDLLRDHDIDPTILVSPEGYLSRAQVIEFLEAAARSFDCPHFGFLVGKHQPPLRQGRLTPIFKLSADLKAAIDNTLIYQPLYSEARIHQLVVEDGYASMLRLDPELADRSATQLDTLVIVQIFKILKTLCGSDWQATSVSFTHSAPPAKQQYLRYFNCPVYFDQEIDRIVFPERILHRPIATADPELLAIVLTHYDDLMAAQEQERDTDDIVAAVSSYIRRNLGSNLCNFTSCAAFFGMHPRALQRALDERDQTFKGLLSALRMELAMHYLRSSSVPLKELAEMLGYGNPSAFTRAFNKAQGISPVEWRKGNNPSSQLTRK